MMSGTSDHLPLAMAAVAAGSFVQGVLGFGCSLVWMSIFPLFTSVPDAVGVLQPLAISLNALILSRTYRHATPRALRALALTAPLGIVFGLWVVTSWSARAVNGLLGAFLLLYTCHAGHKKGKETCGDEAQRKESSKEELSDESESEFLCDVEAESIREETQSAFFRSPTSLAAGFVGGCLTSAFGTGGPAILVYAREEGWEAEPDKFRANMQAVFFPMNVAAISSQIAGGIITAGTARSSAMLLPALVGGGVVGSMLAPRVPRELFRTFVINGLRVMGVLFVSKALR